MTTTSAVSWGEDGAAHALEPALLTSEARVAKRRQHRVSAGQDARSERPARGCGQPRPVPWNDAVNA